MMREFEKSNKLEGVSYDVRGPVLEEAERMQEEGISILKLNTGNPALTILLNCFSSRKNSLGV